MKRIPPTDPPIPNTIDRDAKRALKERSIVNHEHVVLTYTMRAGRATGGRTAR